jgi:hypothetical protein
MASKLPGFRAEPFAVMGNFSFQKLAMVKDLENHRDELLLNDVVGAIAGDSAVRRKLRSSQIETDPGCLDAVRPDNEFAVVEANLSQQCAIARYQLRPKRGPTWAARTSATDDPLDRFGSIARFVEKIARRLGFRR